MSTAAESQPRADLALSDIAQCIAEPVRARMLCCLLDGHARTATELASVGDVAASTASSHLARLLGQGLVQCQSQGRHRYYRLAGGEVGAALEALLVVAARQAPASRFEPSTPEPLREARRCYDHMAGQWAVRLHDHALRQGWLTAAPAPPRAYALSASGREAFMRLGVDVETLPARRRLACACMDWSERRPHLGGALGAAWLTLMLHRGWLVGALDSRALQLTRSGRQGLERLLGG